LCSSTNWTTFILVDFEVFRWNLENAAKVLKDIHRCQGLSGIWPCLWPRIDHHGVLTCSRGLIGCVGEVFEVGTQVWPMSAGLTWLICPLALMMLLKNLGRHRVVGY
jgi:hypothetical protein